MFKYAATALLLLATTSCSNLPLCGFGEEPETHGCRPSNASQARGTWMSIDAACPTVAQEPVSECRASYECKLIPENRSSAKFQACVKQNLEAQTEKRRAAMGTDSPATPPPSNSTSK